MVLNKKLGPYKIVPNHVPKKNPNLISREQFVAIWSAMTEAMLYKLEKAKHDYYFTNMILYLRCPVCERFKEATTDNFTAANASKKGGILKWFDHFPHSFNVGALHGCKSCFAEKSLIRDSDTDGDGYLKHIMSKYPQLHRDLTDAGKDEYKAEYKRETGQTLKKVPQTDGGMGWIKEHLGKVCAATGFIMNPEPIKGSPFNPSPNSIDIQRDGKYSQKDGHAPDKVEAVCAFAQIQQGSTNIPNLHAAFNTLYKMMVADFYKTPEQLVAEETEAMTYLKSPFSQVIHHIAGDSKEADKKKGRKCDINFGADVAERLKKVRMRCHTSGVLMSHLSGWNKAHGDRIDDAIGHVDGNIEWKCALFNGPKSITREEFLRRFIKQRIVPVPPEMCAAIEAELAADATLAAEAGAAAMSADEDEDE